MPEFVNAFPLTIYRDKLPLAPPARQRMIEMVLEMGRKQANKGEGSAWTGDINGFGFLHQDERFAELFALLSQQLRQYLDLLRIGSDKLSLYYTRSWATLTLSDEQIGRHAHMQSHISLAYYLKKPENSGGIVFVDHDSPNQFAPRLFSDAMLRQGIVTQPMVLNSAQINLEPEEGDVLIFPSKILHATKPNLSGEPRISISSDIIATARNTEFLEHMMPDIDRWSRVG